MQISYLEERGRRIGKGWGGGAWRGGRGPETDITNGINNFKLNIEY